jgi:hypothetical protein
MAMVMGCQWDRGTLALKSQQPVWVPFIVNQNIEIFENIYKIFLSKL